MLLMVTRRRVCQLAFIRELFYEVLAATTSATPINPKFLSPSTEFIFSKGNRNVLDYVVHFIITPQDRLYSTASHQTSSEL